MLNCLHQHLTNYSPGHPNVHLLLHAASETFQSEQIEHYLPVHRLPPGYVHCWVSTQVPSANCQQQI